MRARARAVEVSVTAAGAVAAAAAASSEIGIAETDIGVGFSLVKTTRANGSAAEDIFRLRGWPAGDPYMGCFGTGGKGMHILYTFWRGAILVGYIWMQMFLVFREFFWFGNVY